MTKNQITTCMNLDEVRRNIDEIDRNLVKLIAKREAYVKQASKFKKTVFEVADSQRVDRVIQRVIDLAENQGASANVIESVWRAMINAFIEIEKSQWKSSSLNDEANSI